MAGPENTKINLIDKLIGTIKKCIEKIMHLIN